MRRIIPIFVVIITAVASVIGVARGAREGEVTLTANAVPTVYLSASQRDVLALDLTIAAPGGDALDDLVVQQRGSARWLSDLTNATLWADAGAIGFQGVGVDRKLASGSWNPTASEWVFTRLDLPIVASGTRVFVTVSTGRSPTSNVSVQLRIPAFQDAGIPMSYDVGDAGVFLRTVRPTPLLAMETPVTLTVRTTPSDQLAPLVRITEPAAGDTFARDWLLVRGVGQDSGGSAISRIRVGVNRVGHAVTWVEAVPEVEGAETWEARLFELKRPETYELRVVAEDWTGNTSAVSDPITVTLTE
ncbi:MAG: hypothetical protein Q7S02_04335 [bacterium]|nr:hypothetical protein [bacterium]